MKKHVFQFTLVATFIFTLLVPPQQLTSQVFCPTFGGPNAIRQIGNQFIPSNMSNHTGPYYIKIYVHIVRKGDKTGGHTIEEAQQALIFLNEAFNVPHGIFFVWDCNIDYIDDDTHYFADKCTGTGYPAIFNVHSNPDGIDIYLFSENTDPQNGCGLPPNTPCGCGLAADVPSSAIYVAGNYWDNTFGALSISHILSHEMGHALGLFHTHHGTFQEGTVPQEAELIDGSNCSSAGDYVCDTPADPNINFNVNPDNCQWLGSVPMLPYNPDELNIMAYSHPKCMTYFSEEQGLRMRQIIATASVLQSCLINPDYIGYTLHANTAATWTTTNTPNNGDFLIEGDLTIENGATLVINAGVTVHFGEQSSLIIKPNGRLVLHGNLSSMGCKGYTWQGVKVWGSSAGTPQSQYLVNGVRAQGRIECYPGSLIENAKVGVELYGPTPAFAGGQIHCDGATIKNCIKGVVFESYQNFWPFSAPSGQQGQPRNYFGSFAGVVFVTDDDYLHNQPFHSFVNMTGVGGVNLSGCSMINSRTINGSGINDWGYGIFANDAGFNVTPKCEGNPVPHPLPCESYKYPEFIGLGYGIYTGNVYTSKPYTVREAVFANCFVGIHNRSVDGGTIILNTFKMGEMPSTTPTSDQIGVVFESDVSGFTCEENTFVRTTSTSPITTIGTICINTGAANKTIRRNKFNELSIGNLANGTNAELMSGVGFTGVYYECNTNIDVNSQGRDLSVPNGRIKLRQGLEISEPGEPTTYGPAGNRFSYTGIDISNFGTQFRYYYDLNGQNQEPVTIEGGVLPSSSTRANSCAANYCAPPCRTVEELAAIKSDYYSEKGAYQTVKSSYLIDPTDEKEVQMSYHRRKMDEGAYMAVLHTLYDTISFHADTLRTWIGNLGSPEGDL